MAEYSSLAELRADLTADDPDERASAYGAVLSADIEVSEVLSSNPPEDDLREAGVIPELDESDTLPPAAETRKRTNDLLEQVVEQLKQMNGGN